MIRTWTGNPDRDRPKRPPSDPDGSAFPSGMLSDAGWQRYFLAGDRSGPGDRSGDRAGGRAKSAIAFAAVHRNISADVTDRSRRWPAAGREFANGHTPEFADGQRGGAAPIVPTGKVPVGILATTSQGETRGLLDARRRLREGLDRRAVARRRLAGGAGREGPALSPGCTGWTWSSWSRTPAPRPSRSTGPGWPGPWPCSTRGRPRAW